MKATKVSTWKNTLTDNGDTDGIEVTYDKVFLPSLEAMSINPQKAGEDDVWEYWKRASGMAEKMQQYKTYPQIRTFAIENHTSPQTVRLRSASRGNSGHAWCVGSGGSVGYDNANWLIAALRLVGFANRIIVLIPGTHGCGIFFERRNQDGSTRGRKTTM